MGTKANGSITGEGLKVCICCGALNRGHNRHCYNCAWGGAFDTDTTHVSLVVEEITREARDIAENRPSLAVRFKTWLSMIAARLILPEPREEQLRSVNRRRVRL